MKGEIYTYFIHHNSMLQYDLLFYNIKSLNSIPEVFRSQYPKNRCATFHYTYSLHISLALDKRKYTLECFLMILFTSENS